MESHFTMLIVIHAIGNAVAVPKLKISRATVHVFLGAVLVDALHAVLEDAEIAFNRVGMNVTASLLTSAMPGEIVTGELAGQLAVLNCLITVDHRDACDVRPEDR
jgi:hypothetical protein